MANASKPTNIMRTYCSLCRKNGEPDEFWRSHKLKDENNKIICPVLSRFTCPICHKTGLHTRSYCPMLAANGEGSRSKALTLNLSKGNSAGGPRAFGGDGSAAAAQRRNKRNLANNCKIYNNKGKRDSNPIKQPPQAEVADAVAAAAAEEANKWSVPPAAMLPMVSNSAARVESPNSSTLSIASSSTVQLAEGQVAAADNMQPDGRLNEIMPQYFRAFNALSHRQKLANCIALGFDPKRVEHVERTVGQARQFIMHQLGQDEICHLLLRILYI